MGIIKNIFVFYKTPKFYIISSNIFQNLTMQTKALNPILTQDPNKLYRSNIVKAKIFKIASIINFLAICLFSAYLISLIGVSTASIPTAYISIGIAVPFFSVFYSKLNTLSKTFFDKALFYKNVITEYNNLKTQSSLQLRRYLFSIGCYGIADPKKILPAIATYKASLTQKEEALKDIKEIKERKTINENLRHLNHKLAFQIFEKDVLKSKLKAAEIHHIINHPETHKTLFDFGKIHLKSFSKRMISLFDNNDTYFVFYDKIAKDRNGRKGLSFTEIDNLSIRNISKLIFD